MHNRHPEESPGLYPMRMVTRLTGLSADTIRAWERRHGAVTPSRSSGNTRRFTADEVRRLVLLREATEGGHSIRSIAPLALSELERLVDRPEFSLQSIPRPEDAPGAGFGELRQAYLAAAARLDCRRAFDILMRGATFLDRQTFVFEVVVPLVREVTDRWGSLRPGSVHERILTGHLRAVLMALLRLAPPPVGAPRLVFATTDEHRHEQRLLVPALLASGQGKDLVYLGSGLPLDEIEWAVRMSRAHVLVVTIARELPPEEVDQFDAMTLRLRPPVQVWYGLKPGHNLPQMVSADVFFYDFERFFDASKGFI